MMLENINNNNNKTTIVTIRLEDCKQAGKAYYKCPMCWYCTDKTDRLKRHLIEEHKVKKENILTGSSSSSNGNGSNGNCSNNNNKVVIDINTVEPEACKVTMNGFDFYRRPVKTVGHSSNRWKDSRNTCLLCILLLLVKVRLG